MNPRLLLLTSFVFINQPIFEAEAIVNLDSLHFDTKNTGKTGLVSLGLSGASGNTEKSLINLDAQFKYSANNYSNIILASYQRGESNNVLNTNKRFAHLRHIHSTSIKQMSWEIYFQLESNQFTQLSLRTLLGGGIRYELKRQANSQHFFGVGGFYSREMLEGNLGTIDNMRANFYLLSRASISDAATFSNTFYYQPDVGTASDFRAINISTLKVKLDQQLSLKLNLNINHDSQPPIGIEATDRSYSTTLEYSF